MKKTKRDIRKILVPVPLSGEMSEPLNQAMHFHRAYGTEIEILHIVSQPGFPQSVLKRHKLLKARSNSEIKLRSMVLNVFGGEIPDRVSLKVIIGSLIPSIIKEANNSRCDLIIIKKAEKNRSALAFFKSENADKLISEAVCPVLTITHESSGDMIKDILIPVDIFKKVSNKIAWAISLSKQFKSRLHIVSVMSMDINPEDSMTVRKSSEIEQAIRKEGIEVDTVVLKKGSGSNADAVLDYANKINPDMIMIMTHQESILRDNYLGSFASGIIHDSQIPVFSVVPCNETILEGIFSTIKLNTQKSDTSS